MPGQRSNSQRPRRGVTVLEVLFATGIAIFGLVGIASLIGVAGRQASDANSWSEGQAAAQYAYSDFVVRGYGNSAAWRWYNDQAALPSLARFADFKSLGGLMRATSVGGMRTPNRHAVCIDPYFFADPTTATTLQTATFPPLPAQPYRPGLFPYFQDDFNPEAPAAPLPGNMGRLLRVSLQSPTTGVLSAKAAERQFQFLDDLAISINEDDKTLPTERVVSFLPAGGVAQGLSKGEYSWFATLCPRELSATEIGDSSFNRLVAPESLHTLSVVVCKRRDRSFLTTPPGSLGERVLTVSPPRFPDGTLANFRGGSGGRVVLSASRDISDSLRVGNWVMLCKEQSLGNGALGTICRWYRVLAVDAEVESLGTTWARNVILDGPDWIFSDTFPTQATLVDGVVTVVERVIPIR